MVPADEVDMQDVGGRITRAREARGWTPAHLARSARIHRTELFHLEKGAKPKVSAAVMWRLCQALGMPFEEIWAGQKPAAVPQSLDQLALVSHQLQLVLAQLLSDRSSAASPASTPSPTAADPTGTRRGRSSRRSS